MPAFTRIFRQSAALLVALSLLTSVAVAQPKPKAPAQDAKLQPTHADVSYGPGERNVLDFYQADVDKPAPLVVNIHGGGFVAGDKKRVNAAAVRLLLARGIHVASINYRFVDGKDVLFPVPQLDGARAVQFLRSKARQWNIDPSRVACMGGSAGAGISMWIGFHDDLADPASSDPVARQSTRIQAIGTLGGQGTYDPIKIKELIGGRGLGAPGVAEGLRSAQCRRVAPPFAGNAAAVRRRLGDYVFDQGRSAAVHDLQRGRRAVA